VGPRFGPGRLVTRRFVLCFATVNVHLALDGVKEPVGSCIVSPSYFHVFVGILQMVISRYHLLGKMNDVRPKSSMGDILAEILFREMTEFISIILFVGRERPVCLWLYRPYSFNTN
jgi:hypothetical protein